MYTVWAILKINDSDERKSDHNMSAELKFKDITEKIIGASFEVHSFLGNGFQACLPKRQFGLQAGSYLSTRISI